MEALIAAVVLAGSASLLREALSALVASRLASVREPGAVSLAKSRLVRLASSSLSIEAAVAGALAERGLFGELAEACSHTEGLHALCSVARSGAAVVAVDFEEWPGSCGVSILSRERALASIELSPCSPAILASEMKPGAVVAYDWRRAPRELASHARARGLRLLSLLDLAPLALPGEPSYSLSRLAFILGLDYDESPRGRARAVLLSSLRLAGALSALGLCWRLAGSEPWLEGLATLCDYAEAEAPARRAGPVALSGADVVVTPRLLDSCSPLHWTPRKLARGSSELSGALGALFRVAGARGVCSEREVLESIRASPAMSESLSLPDTVWEEGGLSLPLVAHCRDALALAELLEKRGAKLGLVFVEAAHACVALAGVGVAELLSALSRVSRRLWVSVADASDVPHYAELAGFREAPVYVVKGAGDLSSLETRRVFELAYSLADSGSCVLATTPASRLSSLELGLRVVERLEDAAECSRVVVPTVSDLRELASRHGVSLKHALVALLELTQDRLVVVSGWRELSQHASLRELEVEPAGLGLAVAPALFSSPRKALAEVERAAREKWGLELRPYQKRIALYMLEPYVRGRGYEKPTVIALLPTGAGKSLVFQSVSVALHRASGRPALVVSPLLALIEDQIEGLERAGVRVCRLDGMAEPAERLECLRRAAGGEVEIVYSTPEQVEKSEARRLVESGFFSLIVLDEAHCAIRWGYTFRPAYAHALSFIKRVRDEKPWLPVAAFTATLSESELRKLAEELGVGEFEVVEGREALEEPVALSGRPKVVKSAVLRSNLRLRAVRAPPSAKLRALVEIVSELREWAEESGGEPWIGLVFVPYVSPSREEESAESIARLLERELEEEVLVYHGQMPKRERSRALDALRSVARGERSSPRIVVATKAFGMGVDIPCIRWVVHYMMSESVEDYYQEVGRAGRDGREAVCILIHSGRSDFKKRLSLSRRQHPRLKVVEALWALAMRAVEKTGSRRVAFRLSRLREELERALGARVSEEELEKSLHVLSLAELADYEVATGVARECRDGYVLADDSKKRVCLTDSPGSSGELDRYCLLEVRAERGEERALARVLREVKHETLMKLVASFRLAELLAREGEERGREAILSYFRITGGERGEDVAEDMRREVDKLALARGVHVKRVDSRRYVAETLSKPARHTVAKALAYAIVASLLDSRTPPSDAVVYTERGLARLVSKHVRAVARELEKRGYMYPDRVEVRALNAGKLAEEPRLGKTVILALARKPEALPAGGDYIEITLALKHSREEDKLR
ncbi:MAG: helicase-related protein [Acidilobaceae archaeon]